MSWKCARGQGGRGAVKGGVQHRHRLPYRAPIRGCRPRDGLPAVAGGPTRWPASSKRSSPCLIRRCRPPPGAAGQSPTLPDPACRARRRPARRHPASRPGTLAAPLRPPNSGWYGGHARATSPVCDSHRRIRCASTNPPRSAQDMMRRSTIRATASCSRSGCSLRSHRHSSR